MALAGAALVALLALAGAASANDVKRGFGAWGGGGGGGGYHPAGYGYGHGYGHGYGNGEQEELPDAVNYGKKYGDYGAKYAQEESHDTYYAHEHSSRTSDDDDDQLEHPAEPECNIVELAERFRTTIFEENSIRPFQQADFVSLLPLYSRDRPFDIGQIVGDGNFYHYKSAEEYVSAVLRQADIVHADEFVIPCSGPNAPWSCPSGLDVKLKLGNSQKVFQGADPTCTFVAQEWAFDLSIVVTTCDEDGCTEQSRGVIRSTAFFSYQFNEGKLEYFEQVLDANLGAVVSRTLSEQLRQIKARQNGDGDGGADGEDTAGRR